MNVIALAFAYLRRRWGQALLSIVVGALGIAAVSTAFVGLDALPDAAERSWGGVDLVIGPKGSALDLVLCCALHISDPRGLVSEKTAMAAASHPLIRVAAPIALGDNVNGLRIVGTTDKLLWVYRADVASGRICGWADENQMAVLPHFSPGYSGWNIAEQVPLWNLFRKNFSGDFPGELEVLDSGMLRPKKSLLAVMGLTRDLEKARRFSRLIPCENCSLAGCQYRRAAYRRAPVQFKEIQRQG